MRTLSFPSVSIPVQDITGSWPHYGDMCISVLRTDMVDAQLSGNKYFKLKYNLQAAADQGHRRLLSFGGPWSSHLHALAAAGQRYGFSTVGLIRGEAPRKLNACLGDAVSMGMQLHFTSRSEYRQKEATGFLERLRQRFGDFYLIPEGGANLAGILGCQEILSTSATSLATDDVPVGGAMATEKHGHNAALPFSHILLACGTGTTMAGLITSTAIPVTGVQVLKGEGYLRNAIRTLLEQHGLKTKSSWQVRDEFHRGGYARCDDELLDFTARFAHGTGISVEPVYTGKLFMAIESLMSAGYFASDAHVLVVHGGGLQGARGWTRAETQP